MDFAKSGSEEMKERSRRSAVDLVQAMDVVDALVGDDGLFQRSRGQSSEVGVE